MLLFIKFVLIKEFLFPKSSLLDLTDSDVNNFETGRVLAVKVRDKITEVFWSEREGS